MSEENTTIEVIIKASMPDAGYPVWAEIRRFGTSMSNPNDLRNQMGLNEEQTQAYLSAYQSVKDGDIESAKKTLEDCFDWVNVEEG